MQRKMAGMLAESGGLPQAKNSNCNLRLIDVMFPCEIITANKKYTNIAREIKNIKLPIRSTGEYQGRHYCAAIVRSVHLCQRLRFLDSAARV
jgi:hypothetical protein